MVWTFLMRMAPLKPERFVFAGIIALEQWAREHGVPLRGHLRCYSLKPLIARRRFVATGGCVSCLIPLCCGNLLRSRLWTYAGQMGLTQSGLAMKLLAL